MSSTSAQSALLRVIELLERLGVRYLVGGSYASGVFGEPRATRDADLLVDMSIEQSRALASGLESDFYADPRMMEDSLRHGISFNIIHPASSFKIDFFPVGADAFRHEELNRRVAAALFGAVIYFSTAEDTMLAKLWWYRDGGETSERQWRDITGIVEVQAEKLDRAYLQKWAVHLEVVDLLVKALREGGR